MKKLIQFFILSIFTLFSCNNNSSKKVSPPDQLAFKVQWEKYLNEYEKTENEIIKKELILKTRSLFTNKKVTNWIGKVKEIKSYDNYAQVVLYQFWNLEENSPALYYFDIGDNSDAYNFVKTLKKNDTIRFSGVLEREMSFTDNGMITEPELLFSCDKVYNYNNIKPKEKTYSTSSYSSTKSYNSSSSDSSIGSKICSWCNKSFSGSHYTHLGKMAPCQSSNSSSSIGKYCSMKCCSDARRSSCPTCY